MPRGAAAETLDEIEQIEGLLVEARSRLLRAEGFDNARLANRLYRARRARDAVFGASAKAFGEPAWDLLLDLYQAAADGRRMAVSSACAGSGAPTTTALRHVARLEVLGLVERWRDTSDRRRTFIRSTDRANLLMAQWLGRAAAVLAVAPGTDGSS